MSADDNILFIHYMEHFQNANSRSRLSVFILSLLTDGVALVLM